MHCLLTSHVIEFNFVNSITHSLIILKFLLIVFLLLSLIAISKSGNMLCKTLPAVFFILFNIFILSYN